MRVISKSRLRSFWLLPANREAEGPLSAWYTHVSHKSVSWHSSRDVAETFATASHVGNCIVFNIGGNKFRLATRILFASQKVFILKVMTHNEYDDDRWKAECGCYEAPPQPAKRSPRAKRG